MRLSRDQKQVLREIWAWFVKKKSPFITFGGYAGTGKTTMVAVFRRALKQKFPKLKVGLCAYTGKAARVLEQALKERQALYSQDLTGTIHSLIYEPQTDSQGQVARWRKKSQLKLDLIIVDEASMVNRPIWRDLTSFKIPILAVGDHGQLPPIEGRFNLMENPQLRLEKIHRQAEDNPIIQLSVKIRKGEDVPFGDFGPVKKFKKTNPEARQAAEAMLRNYSEQLLVLVGYNHSRVALNQQIRQLNDFFSQSPQPGDWIICLKNNYQKGIYNGMRGQVISVDEVEDEQGRDFWYQLEAKMVDGLIYSGKVLKKQFHAQKTLTGLKGLKYPEMGDLFDFGYCSTVHKAQGSQAPQVLLFEERFKQMDDQEWQRWLYTAVTRAERELTIVA